MVSLLWRNKVQKKLRQCYASLSTEGAPFIFWDSTERLSFITVANLIGIIVFSGRLLFNVINSPRTANVRMARGGREAGVVFCLGALSGSPRKILSLGCGKTFLLTAPCFFFLPCSIPTLSRELWCVAINSMRVFDSNLLWAWPMAPYRGIITKSLPPIFLNLAWVQENSTESYTKLKTGSCQKRQKPQAPTSQAPIRNRQTRKDANAKGLNRNTNIT